MRKKKKEKEKEKEKAEKSRMQCPPGLCEWRPG